MERNKINIDMMKNELAGSMYFMRILEKCRRPTAPDFSLSHNRLTLRALYKRNCLSVK